MYISPALSPAHGDCRHTGDGRPAFGDEMPLTALPRSALIELADLCHTPRHLTVF
jgi:hypothetical protein